MNELGFMEEELARAAQEPLRLLAERAAQAKANETPCLSPKCETELERPRVLGRSIDSRFGRLAIYRKYGWCEPCAAWDFPADLVLGLNKNGPASPYLQEVAALLNTKMPSEQAVEVARRFELELSRCFLHREAHRQAIDCGLGQAQDVLVIADGAVWIWKAVADRFPKARCRLDLYHGAEHLWTVAHELYGKGTPEARQWVEPLRRQYQCRFKRTVQSWSLEGDEALMCLESFWRNGRWHDLFPHAKPPSFANN